MMKMILIAAVACSTAGCVRSMTEAQKVGMLQAAQANNMECIVGAYRIECYPREAVK